jgi:hypothetical protein
LAGRSDSFDGAEFMTGAGRRGSNMLIRVL